MPPPAAPGPGLTRVLVGTPALALLALVGNYFNMPLFFGVDVLFGSIAVLLALVWLGTWPGLLVALVGGAYTWFLWDHPYALITLVGEAVAVAWHRARTRRRGRDAPPLAVSVTLYWFLIGIPLVLLCYHWGLGMGWPPTLLVAVKQALNGILNAALAGLMLLAVDLSRRRRALPVAQVLFSVLLSSLLVPSLLITTWQSRDLKGHLEDEQAERLGLFAELAVHHLGPRYHPDGRSAADREAEREHLNRLLREHLPAGSEPQVRWSAPPGTVPAGAPAAAPCADPGQLPQRETGIPTGTAGLTIILPSGRLPSRMARWRGARYRMEVPGEPASPAGLLAVEFDAAPLIDRLQETVTRILLVLLALAGLGVGLAWALSRQLVRPLRELVEVTAALPAAIREDRPWPTPRPGRLREPGQLADAVAAMARSLTTSFRALAQENLDSARLRERLHRSETRLAESQRIADMGSWYLDLRTDEVEWSDQGYRLLGYAPGSVAPTLENFLRRVHPRDRGLITSQLRSVLAGEDLTDEHDVRIRRLNGDERIVHYRTRIQHDPEGRVSAIEGVSIDITERKEAELALSAERRRLSNIIAGTRVGTWEWEVQTGVILVNARWAEILGYQLADLAPLDIQTWIDLTEPADLKRSLALLEAHFRGELDGYECELRMRHRDGHWVWVLDQGRVMERDAAGAPRLMSGIHQDISERKQAEAALAQRESMVDELLALAMRLVGVPDQGLDALTAEAIERIGRFAHADRSYVILLDESAGTLTNTLEWAAAGVAPALAQNQAIPISTLPELMLQLRLGEPVVIPRVTDLPAGWSREREIFRAQEIQSLLVAPLAVGEVLLGCVGFDAVRAPRDWSPMQIRFLQVFASVLAGAMDRAHATADLRASNARYEQLAHQSRSMSWEIDPQGRYTYVNPVCEQVLGYRADELIGQHFYDLLPTEDRATVKAAVFAIMQRREPIRDFDRLCLGVQNWRVWLMSSGAPMLAPDGTFLGYRGIDTDITDRHLAQDLIRENETRYAAQLEELVDLINRPLPPTDKDRALLELGCRTLGATAAVLGLTDDGRRHRVLTAIPDAGADGPGPAMFQAVLAETLAQRGTPCVLGVERLPGAAVTMDLHSCVGLAFDAPRPDGPSETLILSLWGKGPALNLGEPERQMIRLIAQRIAAVRYQEQIQRDLVESRERETIGHLASGVAHDFNNLLGVIDANIYFLSIGLPGADSDPELRQVLEETQSALGQAKVITSGMLSLSRAGGVPLEPVDLQETVAELARILLQVLPAAIRLSIAIAPGLKARTNAGFLQAALLNLALNARDAMPGGGELRIEAAPSAGVDDLPLAVGTRPAMDCVELRVTDTGSGIEPAILPNIFDPLFSTKAKQRGHGLGLFMVQEFIARSGAGLAVESRPGCGTSFRLLLPAVSVPTPVPGTDPRSPPAVAADPGSDGLPPGLRVLVVDDDPRVREAVARLLTLGGVDLAQAEHGQAALALLAQDPGFDLVLSDIAMPTLDGIGLFRHLARERPGLPVILMTGQDSALAGLDDLPGRPLVLRKPLDPAALRAAIRARVRPARKEVLSANERK